MSSRSAAVFVYRPKSAQVKAETVARLDRLRDEVAALGDDLVPFSDRMGILRTLSRRRDAALSGASLGAYSMIQNFQFERCLDALDRLPASCRPRDVVRVFMRVIPNLVPGSGRLNLSREQIAEKLNMHPAHVSKALSVLVRLEILTREVVREDGMRGPGRAVFFINPHVGWNGPLELQAAAQSKRVPPLLKLAEASAS